MPPRAYVWKRIRDPQTAFGCSVNPSRPTQLTVHRNGQSPRVNVLECEIGGNRTDSYARSCSLRARNRSNFRCIEPYNEDFMMCRKEKWNSHGPGGCLKEGRKVTRCAISVIEALNKVCGDAYKTHYECLDNHNQQYKDCRPAERGLNACAFMKLGLVKVVPGTPEGQTPLWLEPNPYYGPKDQSQDMAGREMEMKYTGKNISRYDKLPFEVAKKKQEAERQNALKSLREKVISGDSSSQDKP